MEAGLWIGGSNKFLTNSIVQHATGPFWLHFDVILEDVEGDIGRDSQKIEDACHEDHDVDSALLFPSEQWEDD